MSDTSQGDGWWQASDGKWYPPETHPNYRPPATPPPPTAAAAVPATPPAPAAAASSQMLPAGVTPASPLIRFVAYLLEGLLAIVTLGIGWIIWASMTAGSGQTPAKKLLNLRAIDTGTLRPVGMGRMFWMRGVVAGFVVPWAILFTIGILLLMPFWDKRNQNLWDKVSSTYVVSDPGDAWATRPDLRNES